jgi:hypothetical protein
MNLPRRIITYNLRDDSGTSNGYYQAIAAFAESSLARVQSRLGQTMADYQRYLGANGDEPGDLRERAFELLTLGVLWQIRADPNSHWTLGGLENLIAALEATGKFTQEIAHLRAWYGYLNSLSPSMASRVLARVVGCTSEFQDAAERALGRYTPNVARFLSEEWSENEARDDRVLRGHQRVEYHLNMVGAEWLTRAFRPAFRAVARKVVIVPPCMRAKPDDECKAQTNEQGLQICQNCTPDCRVNQITRLGEKHGFKVYLIPDELRSLAAHSVGSVEQAVGVVGISCALTNAPGGWEAQSVGLPAQGLLLDYCGCSYHWDDEGFPTDTNLHKLLEILKA